MAVRIDWFVREIHIYASDWEVWEVEYSKIKELFDYALAKAGDFINFMEKEGWKYETF